MMRWNEWDAWEYWRPLDARDTEFAKFYFVRETWIVYMLMTNPTVDVYMANDMWDTMLGDP